MNVYLCRTDFFFSSSLYFNFGPGGLRAPYVLARAMRSLAIVITIVQSFFLSPSFAFDPLRGISRVRKFVFPNILA